MIVRQKNGKKSVTEMPAANMTHFRADQKYVEAFFPGGSLLLDDSLFSMESQLVEQGFVRIHRNALVSRAYIERLQRHPSGHYELHLRDLAEPLTVSRRHVAAMQARLLSHA